MRPSVDAAGWPPLRRRQPRPDLQFGQVHFEFVAGLRTDPAPASETLNSADEGRGRGRAKNQHGCFPKRREIGVAIFSTGRPRNSTPITCEAVSSTELISDGGCLAGAARDQSVLRPAAPCAAMSFAIAGAAMAPSGRGAPGAAGFWDGSKASPRPPCADFRMTGATDRELLAEGSAASRAAISSPMRSTRSLGLAGFSADFRVCSTLPETSGTAALISVFAGPGCDIVRPTATASFAPGLCRVPVDSRSSFWVWGSSAIFRTASPIPALCMVSC